jgi:hypothetical protein
VAPRAALSLANISKSRTVLSVTRPTAETHVRQERPHCAAGPSVRHSNCMVAGLVSPCAIERPAKTIGTLAEISANTQDKYRFTRSPVSTVPFRHAHKRFSCI